MFQGSLPSPFSHLLCGVTRWGSLPIFLPLESPVAGKSKKGMKGGCCGQGAGTGFRVPDSKRPGKVRSEGWSCPNQMWLVLISSRALRAGQRGIKGGQGYLFTFFPSFLAKGDRSGGREVCQDRRRANTGGQNQEGGPATWLARCQPPRQFLSSPHFTR